MVKFGAFCFSKIERKGPDICDKVFCILFLFIFICMWPCFHRFGYVLLCSVLRHMAVVDVIVGMVFNKCIDQCLMSP